MVSTQGNGCEAWRLPTRRYDPLTDAKCASLVIGVVGYKIGPNHDIQAGLVQWGSLLLTFERDHKVAFSSKMRRAFLINIMPKAIQGKLFEHLDRMTTYALVREKAVSLVQAGKGPGDMDCSNLNCEPCGQGWSQPGWDDIQWQDDAQSTPEEGAEEAYINAASANSVCNRCGGRGHFANKCATPSKGGGKGGKADQGGGKGGEKGGKGGFGGGMGGKDPRVCSECGKAGHIKAACWTLHPEEGARCR